MNSARPFTDGDSTNKGIAFAVDHRDIVRSFVADVNDVGLRRLGFGRVSARARAAPGDECQNGGHDEKGRKMKVSVTFHCLLLSSTKLGYASVCYATLATIFTEGNVTV